MVKDGHCALEFSVLTEADICTTTKKFQLFESIKVIKFQSSIIITIKHKDYIIGQFIHDENKSKTNSNLI